MQNSPFWGRWVGGGGEYSGLLYNPKSFYKTVSKYI